MVIFLSADRSILLSRSPRERENKPALSTFFIVDGDVFMTGRFFCSFVCSEGKCSYVADLLFVLLIKKSFELQTCLNCDYEAKRNNFTKNKTKNQTLLSVG